MSRAPGRRLGPYEVVAPLGSGGMGEVFRARDTRLGRDVAVKVLPEGFSQDPDRLARFQREAGAVAALSHPHIIALHDVGEEQGTAYTVTELLEGETLGGALRRGPLPVRKRCTTEPLGRDSRSACTRRVLEEVSCRLRSRTRTSSPWLVTVRSRSCS